MREVVTDVWTSENQLVATCRKQSCSSTATWSCMHRFHTSDVDLQLAVQPSPCAGVHVDCIVVRLKDVLSVGNDVLVVVTLVDACRVCDRDKDHHG